MKYGKPSITIDQQISQLKRRGLTIKDEKLAAHYLANISYYRLAGYWWAMQSNKEAHAFKPGSTFENVIDLYNFDRELRLLVFDTIARIEISFRTKLIYHLSHECTPWWFEEEKNFKNKVKHTETLLAINKELKRTKEVFIKEHYKKYHIDLRRPPAWKTLEIASLGNNSKLYGNLSNTIKSKNLIAAEFGVVNHTYLHSWLQSVTQIRNLCAHHSRLWNKNLPGRPKLLSKPPYPWLKIVPPSEEHYKLYIHLCCMKYLMNTVSPGNRLTKKLNNLLIKYSNIDPNALGLKPDWQNEPLWQQ